MERIVDSEGSIFSNEKRCLWKDVRSILSKCAKFERGEDVKED